MTLNDVDAQGIAALLDGTLRGKARERVIRHLLQSREAYQVFVESALEIHGPTSDEAWERDEHRIGRYLTRRADPSQSPAKSCLRRVLTWLSGAPHLTWPVAALGTAAIAAVAVGMGIVATPGSEAPLHPVQTAALVSELSEPSLARGLTTGWERSLWPATRGETIPAYGLPFRLGVRFVDLRVAIHLADGRALTGLTAEIDHMISSIDFGHAILAQYRSIVLGLEEGISSDSAWQLLAGIETLIAEAVDPSQFAAGAWTEATRLAAAVGDTAFLVSRASRHGQVDPRQVVNGHEGTLPYQVMTLIKGGASMTEVERAATAAVRAARY